MGDALFAPTPWRGYFRRVLNARGDEIGEFWHPEARDLAICAVNSHAAAERMAKDVDALVDHLKVPNDQRSQTWRVVGFELIARVKRSLAAFRAAQGGR